MLVILLLLLLQTLEGDPRAPHLPGTVQTFCKLFGLCHQTSLGTLSLRLSSPL